MKTSSLIVIFSSLTFLACGSGDKKSPFEEAGEKQEKVDAKQETKLANQNPNDINQKNSQKPSASKPLEKKGAKVSEKPSESIEARDPSSSPVEAPETEVSLEPVQEPVSPEVVEETIEDENENIETEIPEPVELVPVDPVYGLKCPEPYDNRVRWSSSAREFYAAVGSAQNPVKNCQDSRNPYTSSKEVLLPAENGLYEVKVCAIDPNDPSRISEEKTIRCSIMLPMGRGF